MPRVTSRLKFTLACLTILVPPLLLNFNTLLKLTIETSAEDRADIDFDHPSSFDYDVTHRTTNTRRDLIQCTKMNRTTQTTYITNVTIEDLYAGEIGRCAHSFKEDTVAFHVGKGGGGTLQKELGLSVNWVHPRPRPSIDELLKNGTYRTLILNVRDPIDRFISAFNWRRAILCHPNDDRIKGQQQMGERNRTIGPAKRPDMFCKKGYEEEELLIRETYQSNPNVMAEALCEDSPLYRDAKDDFNKIYHNIFLVEWIRFLFEPSSIKPSGINQFIVIPVEKRSGANATLFEKHIENVRQHLLSNRYGAETAQELMRWSEEKKLKKMKEKSKKPPSEEKKHQHHLHSSANFFNSTKPKLSALGECCLARFFTSDYRLILTMLGGETGGGDFAVAGLEPFDLVHPVVQMACSWGNEEHQQQCRGDLVSMLSRRAKYFDTSKGSCSALVSDE